jgi:hypothetical protein
MSVPPERCNRLRDGLTKDLGHLFKPAWEEHDSRLYTATHVAIGPDAASGPVQEQVPAAPGY